MSEEAQRMRVALISHTHWDREWYLPFERFRYRLIGMIEDLLDLLDRDPSFGHFMLDGQSVLVDDVLAVRPSLEDRLRRHVQSGRLAVGPWYVLADEFLVQGESLVRNLLFGQRAAARLGRPMRIGYLPDLFGHVAQMPRILRGFDIDTAVLWRGVGDRAPASEWRWRAPGGAEVLCLWLQEGYGEGARLEADLKSALARLDRIVARTRERGSAGVALWMNGSDHLGPQPHIPALLQQIRAARPQLDVMHTSLEQAAQDVRHRVAQRALPELTGELRRPGPGHAHLLPGVLSSRTWQQRCHDEVEHLLARLADPFAALSGIDRAAELRRAWKLLLQCQPHDSICGCSSDEVHAEVDHRLANVRRLGEEILQEAVRRITGDSIPRGAVRRAIAVVQPASSVTDAVIDGSVNVDAALDPQRLCLQGPSGMIPVEILSVGPIGSQTEPFDPLPSSDRGAVREISFRLLAQALPPCGVRVLEIREADEHLSPTRAAGLALEGDGVTNGSVSVRPRPGGFEVEDRRTSATLFCGFVDEGDRGDAYNFCGLAGEDARTSADVAFAAEAACGPVCAELRLRGSWALPRALGPERDVRQGEGILRLALVARLVPGARRVDIELELDHWIHDHRLRAAFHLGQPLADLWTDTSFGWVHRSAGGPPPTDADEQPVATHPMSQVTVLETSRARVALGTVGLKEVELAPDGTCYLTVLRATGWLSRPDLSSRRGGVGPDLPTPGAQGPGTHRFRYALAFDRPGAPLNALASALEPGLFPPRMVSLHSGSATEISYLTLQPETVRLHTLKTSEAGDCIVVRTTGEPETDQQAVLHTHFPLRRAWLSDLDERPGEELPLEGARGVGWTLPAHEVVTVALEPER